MTYIILIMSLLLSPSLSLADEYRTGNQTCYGFPRVVGLKTDANVCVGLVADLRSVPWQFPRKVVIRGDQAFVSAYGGWERGRGQVWRLDLRRNEITQLVKGSDRTHGLRFGPDGWLYFGDATAIYRINPDQPTDIQLVIQGLPDAYVDLRGKRIASNHPLSEFIFLDDGSMVVNVGAPSNDCSEEYAASKACHQRDVQAELRHYAYDPASGTFDQNFTRLARGLRNSMGLLFNEWTREIYQAENGSDAPGTPDELNILNMKVFNPNEPFDFGWPFCFGMGDRYPGYSAFRTFCASRALKPAFLLPAHAAPLDMHRYSGRMFPELTGKILITYHGHRPSGSRLAVWGVDGEGRPTGFERHLVDGWQQSPKGAPVGIAEDSGGAIFVVDDKNHALLVVASTTEAGPGGDEQTGPQVGVADLPSYFSANELRAWERLSAGALKPARCQSCHGDVVVNGARETLANMINARWLKLGEPRDAQTLWTRVNGASGTRIMPPPPASPLSNTERQELQRFIDLLPAKRL